MNADDVVLTLGIMLATGLVVQPIADPLRLPRMLLLGQPHCSGRRSSTGSTFRSPRSAPGAADGRRVAHPVHGGLQLSVRVLSRVAIGLGMLVLPGVIVTAVVVGLVASAVFDVSTSMGLLIGAALAPTDPPS